MRPATDGPQRCLQFEVDVQPRARVFAYRDFLGNWVHHFDIPRRHRRAGHHRASAGPDGRSRRRLPAALPRSTPGATVDEWVEARRALGVPSAEPLRRVDARAARRSPRRSRRAAPRARSADHRARRRWPRIHARLRVRAEHDARGFADRRGAGRAAGRLPGLHPRDARGAAPASACPAATSAATWRRASRGRTAETATIATHAWVEVLLPELGWVGFDPTHNIEAGVRHVRVAIGRDYADVPPTRGVFKGKSAEHARRCRWKSRRARRCRRSTRPSWRFHGRRMPASLRRRSGNGSFNNSNNSGRNETVVSRIRRSQAPPGRCASRQAD